MSNCFDYNGLIKPNINTQTTAERSSLQLLVFNLWKNKQTGWVSFDWVASAVSVRILSEKYFVKEKNENFDYEKSFPSVTRNYKLAFDVRRRSLTSILENIFILLPAVEELKNIFAYFLAISRLNNPRDEWLVSRSLSVSLSDHNKNKENYAQAFPRRTKISLSS